MTIRSGIGYDIHRTVAGRPMVLGGVTIEGGLGLDGYSDADVLLHAIGDALLGAAALGDLGDHFPPGDPRWKDCSSLEILRFIQALTEGKKLRPTFVDSTVIAEAPKIAPHREAIRARLAALTGCGQVNIKAKTMEGLGPVGAREAIECHAVAELRPA